MKNIRNFCIIAHIDHGKSTLADRLLETTKTLSERELQAQVLDDMDLEREKGITIKSHAIQMEYVYKGEKYVLNLIDTPGHVDFSYEVSRAIASCEGALLEKLHLNDASLTYEPESSLALGFGFRCGFLGLLHMEIIQERLYREFDMDVITTVPNVSYKVHTTKGDVLDVHNPSGLPEPTLISSIEEPYILAQIITKTEYLGNVIKLCIDKRGTLLNQVYITQDRVEINFDMPLAEIVFDFYDKLKSISRGYASFDYHQTGYKPSKLAKLDILLNGEPVDALSSLTYVDHAYDFGRKMCEKLKELIPRQQFDIAIQAAIGAKIIARETVKAVRKDVTAKCYGGDISRKRKLLEKQKKGKKRMRQVGNVEVPQEAFLAVLKME